MEDNPQTKVEKLIKYGNDKFGLSETTLRGVLDNASAGISDEWQPNPTWWDIKTILENDTRDYDHKAIYLLKDDAEEQTITLSKATAVATSDGAFYDLSSNKTFTHTWDTAQDKPCLIDGIEVYKTRYLIVYTNPDNFKNVSVYKGSDLLYIVTQDLGEYILADNFDKTYNLQAIDGDIIGSKSFTTAFSRCYSLVKSPKVKNGVSGSGAQTFYMCSQLKEVSVDASNMSATNSMYSHCASLENVGEQDFLICTNASSMFSECTKLKNVKILNAEKLTNVVNMFYKCRSLEVVDDFDTPSLTKAGGMFQYCDNLKLAPKINTRNATEVISMFAECYALITIPEVDLLSSTNNYNIVGTCYALRNVTFKNIKLALQIGSGTSWGTLLTLDSLLNTIKELWDNTSGTSTLTLTVATPSKTVLQNTYVKLVDITDEMRAEDEYIDNKKPFVVCESTDEGAMTAEEYVISKNWQLA